METQNRRGLVLLAAAFAGVAIVSALVVSLPKNTKSAAPVAAVTRASETTKPAEVNPHQWQRELALTAKTYAPGAAPTDVISAELAAAYGTLSDEATAEEDGQAIINEIVARSAPRPTTAPALTVAELTVSAHADVGVYATLLSLILNQSTAVREYEVATFSRAARDKNYDGSPELTEAATIYYTIRDALTRIEIPEALAEEHLAAVNDIGALAHIVAQMSVWSGDPIEGIAYIGTFEKASVSVAHSLSALVAHIQRLTAS